MTPFLAELWKYRALVFALVGRHLTSRYRGSLLGYLWSLLNPLGLMLVYTLVFRYYMRIGGVENYSVFLFTGLLPWLWTTSSLSESTNAIVGSGHLITKSLFPAQVLPTVSVLTNLIHFLLALPVLVIFMLVAGVSLHWTWLLLPFLLVLQAFFLLGLSLLLSSLNVFYRDVQHVLGNILTLLFFLCPILYPVEQVPEQFRGIIYWNPFALFTTFYHNILLEGSLPESLHIISILGVSFLFFLLGVKVFGRYREGFAEVL